MSCVEPLVVDGERIYTIRQINKLPRAAREQVYRRLIPPEALLQFGISPSMADEAGSSLLTCVCAPGTWSVAISLYRQVGDRDPLVYLEMANTFNNQLEVLLFTINDPDSKRYDIDVMPDGRSTELGTGCRNLPEEIRAMEAGLAPGQVRHGAKLSRRLIPRFEQFVQQLDHDRFQALPLAYHSAILFERYGFAYARGQGRMEWIHQQFAPGGLLARRLDGSTPFRRPEQARTVRGRSWAIHAGVLGESFTDVHMYKRVNRHAGICTFPDAEW